MFNSDLNIFYSGGSGGFYFLHCLLLRKQHFCCFPYHHSHGHHAQLRLGQQDYENIKDPSWPRYENYSVLGNQGNKELKDAETQWAYNPEVIPNWANQQFELVHQHNWNLNLQQWKSSEIWPNNERTLNSNCSGRQYRIFFNCNDVEKWLQLPGKKIVLFTDIKTQIRLAMFKKAWLYSNLENSISITKSTIRNAKIHKGCLVYHRVFDLVDHAEHTIKLQDFVKDMLSNPVNSDQYRFTQQWLNYHPSDLLDKCSLA